MTILEAIGYMIIGLQYKHNVGLSLYETEVFRIIHSVTDLEGHLSYLNISRPYISKVVALIAIRYIFGCESEIERLRDV